MESIITENSIVPRQKTEIVMSYYEKHRDKSGDSFEIITSRKEKLIKKYIHPLNSMMLSLQEEIMNRPGDLEFRNKIIDIQGQLYNLRSMLIQQYQLDQTIK